MKERHIIISRTAALREMMKAHCIAPPDAEVMSDITHVEAEGAYIYGHCPLRLAVLAKAVIIPIMEYPDYVVQRSRITLRDALHYFVRYQYTETHENVNVDVEPNAMMSSF